jgi:hypothetical protein
MVQLWTEWLSRGMSAMTDCGRLFTLIAQCTVGNRSGRIDVTADFGLTTWIKSALAPIGLLTSA